MGWICKGCGTENDFSVTRCRACDTVVNCAFIQRERLAVQVERKRHAMRAARRNAQAQPGFERLADFNENLCVITASMLFGWLIYLALSDFPDLPALPANAAHSLSLVRQNALGMSRMFSHRLGGLDRLLADCARRLGTNLDAASLVLSSRGQHLLAQCSALASRAAPPAQSAGMHIGLLGRKLTHLQTLARNRFGALWAATKRAGSGSLLELFRAIWITVRSFLTL